MKLTKENIVKFLDEKKVVYAENTPHAVPPEGYEMGDEVEEVDSEHNEVINWLIREIEHDFTE